MKQSKDEYEAEIARANDDDKMRRIRQLNGLITTTFKGYEDVYSAVPFKDWMEFWDKYMYSHTEYTLIHKLLLEQFPQLNPMSYEQFWVILNTWQIVHSAVYPDLGYEIIGS